MKEKPIISFVVAVYNVESYLEKCLKSLEQQKFQEKIEVLLIDDGSTDSSGTICEKIAHKYRNYHYIHQENEGVSTVRNLGIKSAQGEWICFIDGDDYIADSLVENILRNLDEIEEKEIALFGYCIDHFKNGIVDIPFPDSERVLTTKEIAALKLGILNVDNEQSSFFKNTCINYHTPWGKLYKRDFLLKTGCKFDKNLRRGQDIFFNFQIYTKACKIITLNFIGYYYRINQKSISNKYNPNIVNINKNLIYAFEREILIEKNNKELKNEFFLFVIRQFMYCAKIDFCHKNNPYEYSIRKKMFLKLREEKEFRESFQKAEYSKLRISVRIPALICKYKLFFVFEQLWEIYQKV